MKNRLIGIDILRIFSVFFVALIKTLRRPESLILICVVAFRVAVAALSPLLPDGAYAVAVGQSFSLSFFDHPPLGFWLPAAVQEIFPNANELALRLPTLCLGFGTLVGLYMISKRIGGRKTAIWALIFGAITPHLTYSGAFIIPDGPLNFGLVFAAYFLIKIEEKKGGPAPLHLWILGGLFLGLALASKYQAALFPIVAFGWIIASKTRRSWLTRPGLWVAVFISLAGLAPVIIWNANNGFTSLSFHSGRTSSALNFDQFLGLIVAQLIFVLPGIALGGLRICFAPSLWKTPAIQLLLGLALLPTVLFNLVFLFSSYGAMAHWAMPGWIFFIPILAKLAESASFKHTRMSIIVPGLAISALVFVLAIHLRTGILTNHSSTPLWDQTAPNLPIHKARTAIYESDILDGIETIYAYNWGEAGRTMVLLTHDLPVVTFTDGRHFNFMRDDGSNDHGIWLSYHSLNTIDEKRQDLLEFAKTIDPNAAALDEIIISRGRKDYFAVLPIMLSPNGG